jgi:DNA (cytosine-5)-methyltransferase 1/site-specific DNA-methyltransferase (adenine-specific)
VWDEISPTIDTRFDTPSNGRNSHPFLHRAITPREAARIQSFPDTFEFLGNKCEVCKQIGNAVPPLLARAIGEQIINDLSLESNTAINGFDIHNADAVLKIEDLTVNKIKVDHIITDPPYNISKKNNYSTMTNAKRRGVDFGE